MQNLSKLPRSFKVLLVGESFSLFGSQISSVMIPLIVVVTLGAGEIALGLVSAISWLPVILVGLIAGAIVDRYSRWHIMAFCNIIRAILILLIPTLAITHNLTIIFLIVISFLVGICNVFFDIAYQTYVPELVSNDMLDRANSNFELIRSVSQLIGPLLGGILATFYNPEYLITIDAFTFLVAYIALLMLPIKFRIPASANGELDKDKNVISDLYEGLRLVWRTPAIRLVVISGACINIFVAGVSALFVIFVTRTLDLGPSAYGLATAMAGIGALCGALSYRYWTRKLQEGACVGVGLAWLALGTFLTATAALPGLAWICLLAGQFVIGYGNPVMNIALVTLRQKITPAKVLGRVNASARVAIMSSLPIGALVVSSIAEASSTLIAICIAGIGELLVLLVLGPLLFRIRVNDKL